MPTIAGVALSNARRVGDRDAVVCGVRRWDWRGLDHEIASAAAVLARHGVRKGSRVVLLASNSPEFVIAAHAASRLGAVLVPVNIRLAPPELAYIVADSGAVAVVFGSDEAALARSTGASSPKVTLLSLGPSADHANLLAGGDGTVDEDRAVEADDAFILYTSGTTGRPKGCLLDHHRAVWAAMAQIVSLGLRDGDRYVHIAPMYHSGGTTFLNATTLLGGTHILAPKKFDPAAVLDIVERDRASWLFGVPTMYQQMLRTGGLGARDVSAWRIGVSVQRRCRRWLSSNCWRHSRTYSSFSSAARPRLARSEFTPPWPKSEPDRIRRATSRNRSPSRGSSIRMGPTRRQDMWASCCSAARRS